MKGAKIRSGSRGPTFYDDSTSTKKDEELVLEIKRKYIDRFPIRLEKQRQINKEFTRIQYQKTIRYKIVKFISKFSFFNSPIIF